MSEHSYPGSELTAELLAELRAVIAGQMTMHSESATQRQEDGTDCGVTKSSHGNALTRVPENDSTLSNFPMDSGAQLIDAGFECIEPTGTDTSPEKNLMDAFGFEDTPKPYSDNDSSADYDIFTFVYLKISPSAANMQYLSNEAYVSSPEENEEESTPSTSVEINTGLESEGSDAEVLTMPEENMLQFETVSEDETTVGLLDASEMMNVTKRPFYGAVAFFVCVLILVLYFATQTNEEQVVPQS